MAKAETSTTAPGYGDLNRRGQASNIAPELAQARVSFPTFRRFQLRPVGPSKSSGFFVSPSANPLRCGCCPKIFGCCHKPCPPRMGKGAAATAGALAPRDARAAVAPCGAPAAAAAARLIIAAITRRTTWGERWRDRWGACAEVANGTRERARHADAPSSPFPAPPVPPLPPPCGAPLN